MSRRIRHTIPGVPAQAHYRYLLRMGAKRHCFTGGSHLCHHAGVTLVDSFGASVRPGIVELLQRLRNEGHALVLWTNSRRDRAQEILRLHDLRGFFTTCICREDYDPEERGIPKDIRRIRGDLLVDDDPAEIAFMKTIGRKGFLIRPYRKGAAPNRVELADLYKAISRRRRLFGAR